MTHQRLKLKRRKKVLGFNSYLRTEYVGNIPVIDIQSDEQKLIDTFQSQEGEVAFYKRLLLLVHSYLHLFTSSQ